MRTQLKQVYKKLKQRYASVLYNKYSPYLKYYDRIYHVHIRKSAGTSVNAAFWGLSGLNLKSVKQKALLIKGKYVFVRHNENLIKDGHFFYANSHIPYWNIHLPKHTFTFCVLRDPYQRLLSLYRYLKWIKGLDPSTALAEEPYYKSVFKQTVWLGKNFNEFLDNLPKKHLQHQLTMFSETQNIEEAKRNISKLDAIYNHADLNKAIQDLSHVVGMDLELKNERAFGKTIHLKISKAEELKAMRLLSDEYNFYNTVAQKYALL